MSSTADCRSKRGKLLPHSPDHLSPIQLPVHFDRKAKCPAWKRFVQDVCPRHSQGALWELLGDLMVPDRSQQKGVLLLGEGGTGKSTFLRVATAFLGENNVSTVDLHKLEGDRFATSQLVGKLANISADLPSKHLEDTAVFKAVTGGDRLAAQRKVQGSLFVFPIRSTSVFREQHSQKQKTHRKPSGIVGL